MVVLFRGVPLESTDGERMSKPICGNNSTLCVHPYHITVKVSEFDLYLSNVINLDAEDPGNDPTKSFSKKEDDEVRSKITGAVDGFKSRQVFGVKEIYRLSKVILEPIVSGDLNSMAILHNLDSIYGSYPNGIYGRVPQ